jgi:NADH-quinone oxidoreductase subunit D
MPTTRDIETPDTLARTTRSLDAINDAELLGEKLTINMGPSHQATNGVLRLFLELDGEIITKAVPDVGYLNRGDEKIAENM